MPLPSTLVILAWIHGPRIRSDITLTIGWCCGSPDLRLVEVVNTFQGLSLVKLGCGASTSSLEILRGIDGHRFR